jgi:FlaA1/EpsC-like NDP-sugar epimerase
MGHATCLAAHAVLVATTGRLLAAPADPVTMTVGELAARIWRECGREGEPEIAAIGIRGGETMTEVLTGLGEELTDEPHQGVAAISGGPGRACADWVAQRLTERGQRVQDANAVWLEALDRPDLLEAPTVSNSA